MVFLSTFEIHMKEKLR